MHVLLPAKSTSPKAEAANLAFRSVKGRGEPSTLFLQVVNVGQLQMWEGVVHLCLTLCPSLWRQPRSCVDFLTGLHFQTHAVKALLDSKAGSSNYRVTHSGACFCSEAPAHPIAIHPWQGQNSWWLSESSSLRFIFQQS